MANPNPEMQDDNNIDDHESEERLSFSDLPVYTKDSIDDHDQDSSNELHQISISSSSDNQGLFEFSSEEWNTNSTTTIKSPTHLKASKNFIPSPSQKPISKNTQKPIPKNSINREKRSLGKSRLSGSKEEGLVPTDSIFTSFVKSRWYLILLGLPPKVPTDEMELMTDIKNRQSRNVNAPSTLCPSGGGEEAAVPRKSDDRLWRFIQAATCFGGQFMHTSVL